MSLHKLVTRLWQWLSHPLLTVGLIGCLSLTLLLRLTLSSFLPATLWYWITLALLLLNVLLALATYLPVAWQRYQQPDGPPTWAQLGARGMFDLPNRATTAPTEVAQQPEAALSTGAGVQIIPKNSASVVISQRRWAWWGLPTLYGGLLILIIALLSHHHLAEVAWLELRPQQIERLPHLNSSLELVQVDAALATATLQYRTGQTDVSPTILNVNRYGWTEIAGVMLWPTQFEPILTVQVRDEAGNRRRLVPEQTNLNPADVLNLSLGQADTPLHFATSSADLIFQIIPANLTTYQLRVRRPTEAGFLEDVAVRTGEPFDLTVDGNRLTVSIALNHKLRLLVYDNPLLWLFLLGGGCLIGGAGVMVIRPARLVWLIETAQGPQGIIEVSPPHPTQAKLQQQLLDLLNDARRETLEENGQR